MGIINYDELEVPIKNIELMLEDYDQEEKALILKFITQRFAKKIQQLKIQENLDGMKFGGLLKKVMKKQKEEDEDGVQ